MWYFHYDRARSDAEKVPYGKLICVEKGQIVKEYSHRYFKFQVDMVTVDTKISLSHRERIDCGLSRFVLRIDEFWFDVHETPERVLVIRREE